MGNKSLGIHPIHKCVKFQNG